jgi:hypothetical protein
MVKKWKEKNPLLHPLSENLCRNKFLFWHYCFFCTRTKTQSLIWTTGTILSFPEWCEVIMKVLLASKFFRDFFSPDSRLFFFLL